MKPVTHAESDLNRWLRILSRNGAVSRLQLLRCLVGNYFVRDRVAFAIIDRQIPIITVRMCRDDHYSSTKMIEIVSGGVWIS